jgi:hypothetical protein
MLDFATRRAPEWEGARIGDPNDPGVVILEAFAYMGDILSYYTDRLANESYLASATQRDSVLRHARHLGYTPRSATAATAALDFTVTTRRDVTIPAGFQVGTVPGEGEVSIVFETARDLAFLASTTTPPTPQTLPVEAVEGVLVADEVVGVSSGELDAVFQLQQLPVIVDSLVIRVVEKPNDPGNIWFPVINLIEATSTDLAYAFSLGGNDELILRFGDGVNGRVAPRGSVIHARYRIGGGADGNVIANTITEVIDPTDIVFPTPDGGTGEFAEPPLVEVTNPLTAGGGADSETLDSIRVNTPRAVRTQERAVSLRDFETLALTIPQTQVAKARAVSKVYTNVTLFVAPPGGTIPSRQMLTAVAEFFGPRKMSGVSVVPATPQYTNIDISLDVIVNSRYDQALIKQAVRRELEDAFDFDVVDFGQRVSLADVYQAVINIEGVNNVLLTKLARGGGTTATDIVLRDNEIPQEGVFTINAIGGLSITSGALEGTAMPTATDAPVIGLLRCDPNSTHVELSWVAGANTTSWDVAVSYLNGAGVVVQSQTTGPFKQAAANIDLPFIGAGRATSVAFSTRAYNGVVGPAVSGLTTTPYTCE